MEATTAEDEHVEPEKKARRHSQKTSDPDLPPPASHQQSVVVSHPSACASDEFDETAVAATAASAAPFDWKTGALAYNSRSTRGGSSIDWRSMDRHGVDPGSTRSCPRIGRMPIQHQFGIEGNSTSIQDRAEVHLGLTRGQSRIDCRSIQNRLDVNADSTGGRSWIQTG